MTVTQNFRRSWMSSGMWKPIAMIWTGGDLDIEYYHQVAEEVYGKKDLKFDGVFGVDRLAIECMNGSDQATQEIPRRR